MIFFLTTFFYILFYFINMKIDNLDRNYGYFLMFGIIH